MIGYAQPVGKNPKFLKNTNKPNFFKMQKKAGRYFKKEKEEKEEKEKKSLLRVAADTATDENNIGFESGYDREEDNEYVRYKRWEWFWRDRVNPDGTFPSVMQTYESYSKLQNAGKNLRTDATNPTWVDVSMFKNSGGYWGLGRTESVAINPKNPLEFYTTSDGGGVWKTIDGGKTYTPVGDKLPMLNCGKVLIDNQTPTTVYVSTGDDHSAWGYGLGVYKSTDGGATWKATGLTATRNSTISIRFMAMSPADPKIIIAVTNKGVYRTTNGGDTWTVVRTGAHFDVVFKPGNGNTVYVSNTDIYKSTDAGLTWNKVSSFNSSNLRMSTSLANPSFLGVALTGGTKQYYVSTDEGANYTLKSTMPEGCEFLVSQTTLNNVYCGCVDNYRSTDGGATWKQFTHWSGGNNLKEVHADNHGINFDPTKPAEIYISNDGGVERFNEQTNTWTYLSNGLAITMYYQIAVAQTNAVVMAGGTQDNGGNMRKKDGTWRNTTGGDANMCLIDPTNENIAYSAYINGTGITRTTNAWTNSTSLDDAIATTGVGEGDWTTPFALHEANPQIIIAGYKDVILSSDRGTSWKKVSNGLSTSNLLDIAISPSSAQHIYTAAGSNFYATFDQGATAWKKVTHPGGSVTSIIVHPTTPLTVYTTNNGGNGKRVYKSTDGGLNWTNISGTGIPNDVSVTSIAYEKNTTEGLYIGTHVGVFYKNATMTSWLYFGSGLPNAPITDLQISYIAKKIRVGTYGRGIWEAPLYSEDTPTCTATINASGSTTICSGSNVLLTASQGVSYIWKNGSAQVGTSQTYTATAAGSYTVEVTDGSACKATAPAVVITVATPTTWYADRDGDGLGDASATLSACAQPAGYVATSGDLCPSDNAKTQPGQCGCGKTEQSCLDCNQVANGTASADPCGRCTGGNTGKTSCTSSIQAEGACEHEGTIDTNFPGYFGAGFVNTSNTTGVGIKIVVQTSVSGNYILGARFANGSNVARGATIKVDGVTLSGTYAFDITGAWSTWAYEEKQLNLTAGDHIIEIIASTASGLPNADLFYFLNANIKEGPCSVITHLDHSALNQEPAVYPNPFTETIHVDYKKEYEYSITDMQGKVLDQGSKQGTALLGASLPKGVYVLNIKSEGIHKVHTITKR